MDFALSDEQKLLIGTARRFVASELIPLEQEVEEKRLLFLYRVAPKPEQRHCVYEWAHRNHLNLVIINAVNEPQS